MAVPLGLLGFAAGVFPIFESDLFWHLATGRWILAHGAVPRIDPFRFGPEPLAWVDHEWLFQVVVRGVELAASFDGLILLRAAALAGFALLLWAATRRAGLAHGLAGLVTLFAVLGVRPRFLVRPEIVTLYAVVLLLVGLERWLADAGRGWKGVVPLLLLTVVWVQFHGEALLAPGLAFLFLAGGALGGRARWREAIGIPALLAAALLANPYGWRLIEVPLGILGALSDLPAHNPEWMSAFEAPQPFLFGGLAAVAALAVVARSRSGGWAAPEWALPTVAMAAVALSGVRHQALFYAVGAPYAARCLAALPEVAALDARMRRRLAGAAAILCALAAAWCVAPPASGPLRPRHGGLAWGFGIAEGRFPVRMAEALAERPGIGPLYNELVHGGYLLWRLHPPRRVFLDGRMELEPELLREIAAARTSAADWDRLLADRGAVGALVRYETRPVPVFEPDGRGGFRPAGTSTANALLFPPERWALADWDDEAMLFLRPGDPAWPEAPYRFVQPEDVEGTLGRAAADPAFRAGVLAELDRKLAALPGCRRALALREAILRPR
ncbi:MAG TPA: hypothetical protein VLA66_11010 [Thermoanaerobaculia bacterium]|nr:hypothetical protein [Thermoanaerobaculia bacterium]